MMSLACACVCVLPFVLVREQLSTWLLGPTTTQAEEGGPVSGGRTGSVQTAGTVLRFGSVLSDTSVACYRMEAARAARAHTRARHVMLFQPPS